MFFVAFKLQFIKVNIRSQWGIKRWKCDFFMPLAPLSALVTTKIRIVLRYLLYVRSSWGITNNTRNTDVYRKFGTLKPSSVRPSFQWFLPRCMKCRRGLAMRILSVRPSVRPGWLRSTVGRTPVFGRRTDPVLRSACSRRVTTMWVNRPLQVSQLGQLSFSSLRGR